MASKAKQKAVFSPFPHGASIDGSDGRGETAKAGEIYEFLERGIPDGYHHVCWADGGVLMHDFFSGGNRLYHPEEVVLLEDVGFFWLDGAGSFPPRIPFELVFKAWKRGTAPPRPRLDSGPDRPPA
jgi:hypothetical protein